MYKYKNAILVTTFLIGLAIRVLIPDGFIHEHEKIRAIYDAMCIFFPFSTIEHHALISMQPDSVRLQLAWLWMTSPFIWYAAVKQVAVMRLDQLYGPEKVASMRRSRLGWTATFLIIFVISAISFLFIPGEPGYCDGCLTRNSVVGGAVRWVLFWGMGAFAGLIYVVAKK